MGRFFLAALAAAAFLAQDISYASSDKLYVPEWQPFITSQGDLSEVRLTHSFGGYRFLVSPKWVNTSCSNKDGQSSSLGFELREETIPDLDRMRRMEGARHSLHILISRTPEVDRNNPVPAVKWLAASLERKGLRYRVITSDDVSVKGRVATSAEAKLKEDGRSVWMLAMRHEDLTLTVTLGYFEKDGKATPEEMIELVKSLEFFIDKAYSAPAEAGTRPQEKTKTRARFSQEEIDRVLGVESAPVAETPVARITVNDNAEVRRAFDAALSR